MMSSYRSDLPHWFAMIGRAVGRGEVNPDVHPAMLLHMMLSPAVSVSLFEERPLSAEEIDALVTLVCRATAVQAPASPAKRAAKRPTPKKS